MAPVQGGDLMDLKTTKSRRSLVSLLGIEHRYKAPLMNCEILQIPEDQQVFFAGDMFCQKCLQICLLLCLQPVHTVLNIRSSFWALTQSVMCICTRVWPVATCASSSKCGHPQIWWGHELWPSVWFPMSLHQRLISLCLGPS